MTSETVLSGRRVTLGVTGGIAAYKAAEIVRLLRKMGLKVQVVMTAAGARLMSEHALATLSENPVVTGLWGRPEIDHIQLSRETDLMIVAPATANVLGKVAGGIADDVLTTAIMASDVPVLFAPSMNVRMWENPAVQANVALLRERGYAFVGPDAGDLACGETGAGRMADPPAVVDAAVKLLLHGSHRMRVLITAGPTEEPIDPVRVLSNRSSGKMGIALAEAARDNGHLVTLVAGPLRCTPGPGIERVDVATAREMLEAVTAREKEADLLIMSAAVADYRPAKPTPAKMSSGQERVTLDLAPNPDILGSVGPGRLERGAVTIGFALEIGEDGETRARAKLEAKGADLMVLNDATQPEAIFGGDTTRITLLFRDGRIERMPTMTKRSAAREILTRAEALAAARA